MREVISDDAWRRYAAPIGNPRRLLARAVSIRPLYVGSWLAIVTSAAGAFAAVPASRVNADNAPEATTRSLRYRARFAGGSRPPDNSPVATVALASESDVYRFTAWTRSGSVWDRAALAARSRDCSAPVAIAPKHTAPMTTRIETRTSRPGVVASRSRTHPSATPA